MRVDNIPLAELRRVAGLTQTELAKRWGRGQRAVSHLESRSDWLLSSLADYLQAAGAHATLSIRIGEEEFTYRL